MPENSTPNSVDTGTERSEAEFPVRKCVCFDVTFAEIRRGGVKSVREIEDRFGAGTGCQTCQPYLRLMLETGETSFRVIDLESS